MKDIIQKIYDYSLEEIMGERFGKYSKYIIQDRAIPDVRDGLKPVQRRILYSMYKEKNTYDKVYRKSARAVGDVMGKYHPHGDSSIYDAMVRMAQYWKLNHTFIDMHGNKGSVDGDSPAAMRYTEARLSKIANELLKDIEKETVPFAPNYDDSLLEPTVLPAAYPNLLVNGTTGISAGYATNIPPHNLGEIIDATIFRIDSPNCRLDSIMNIVKGPDLPTGGILEGKKGIEDAYKTGRGKVIIKSKTKIEKGKKNSIIIDEIPYEVNKANLVRQMDDIRINKKIEGIIEVRDESDREGMRIAIDLKKEVNPDLILNYLFKNTELQVSYSFNMIAIVDRRPKLLGILEILDSYIIHQKEVITKSKKFDLLHAKKRLHIVEGLIKAISILDEVIITIRKSKNKQDAQDNLVKKYDFSEKQAEAIVTLQLYRLTNTDITTLENEFKNLVAIIKGLLEILNDEKKLMNYIKDELRKTKKEYAKERKTIIKEEISELIIDETLSIPKEDVIVIITKDGYLKRVSKRSFQTSNEEDTNMKENDYLIGFYEMNTLDTLLLFTDLGNYLYIPVIDIPELKYKELGKHVSNIVTLKQNENIIYSLPVYDFNEEKYITIFTKNGNVKRTKLLEYKVQRYSKPILNIKLKQNDKVNNIIDFEKPETIIITKNGYALKYDTSEIPVTGIKTAGVKAINLKDDELILGTFIDETDETISIITDKGNGKRIKLLEIDKISRARKGNLILKEVKSNIQKIQSAIVAKPRTELGLKSIDNIKIIKNSELPIMDKKSAGSNICKKEIIEAFLIKELTTKESVEKAELKEEISLDQIDEKILTIDDFLKGFNNE